MTPVKWAAIGIIALIALATGWYHYSPVYTLQQMKAAALANDSDAFAAYIDFPALREDMKAEVMAQMMAEAQKNASDFGGLGLAIGAAAVGPMIDSMVSPAGLRAAFISNERRSKGAHQESQLGAFALPDKPTLQRRNFSEFSVRSGGPDDGGMVFKRSGMGWKLSGIDLPTEPSGTTSRAQPIDPYTKCLQDAQTDEALKRCRSLREEPAG